MSGGAPAGPNRALVEEVVRRVLAEVDLSAQARRDPAGGVPAPWPPRRVAFGSDHGGFAMKEDLRRFVEAKGFEVVDCGTRGPDSVDYPDYAAAVARRVRDGDCQAGVVVDAMGIGSAIAANKVPGVRCALCHDVATARNSREHNDANVLSLGAKVVSRALARRIVAVWLATSCTEERHLRRVRKIVELER